MAEGWARHLAPQVAPGVSFDFRSGGSRPLGHILPEAIAVMAERGVDISRQASRGFDEAWIRSHCRLVVTMGCGEDACPAFMGKKVVDWELPDPKGMDLGFFRDVRDDIERRVRGLLGDLNVA